MVNRIGTLNSRGSNNGFSSNFLCEVQSSTWNTWRRPEDISVETCEHYYNDEVSSPNILSDNTEYFVGNFIFK